MYLAIDASTMTGSAALFEGDRLVDERTVAMKGVHEERLMPAIVDLVTAHGGWGGIEALVVGGGPGSFTSLRIAAAIAKGIATSLGISLNVVPSHGLLVAQAGDVARGRYLATLDAMRGECFVAMVEVGDGGRIASVGQVVRLAVERLGAHAAHLQATVVGQVTAKVNDPGHAASAGATITGNDPGHAAFAGATGTENDSGHAASAGATGTGNETGHAAFAGATGDAGTWVPHARGAGSLVSAGLATVVDLATWEPDYGRLAEAQVKWEAEHGRPLLAVEASPPDHPATRPPDARSAP